MHALKKIIKKLTPRFAISAYHLLLAYLGALFYSFPSHKMVVVGVLGTRGKTTVANLIWAILTAAGYKTGLTGTANIRVGNEERINKLHMTMPGRFTLQKLLREMYDAGCQFVVVETPSEGVEQWRHKGIAYDAAVMTTLYPEYLAVHGLSFERCKEMHEKVFAELAHQPKKILNNKKIPKTIVMNNAIEEKDRFLRHRADVTVTYALKGPADFIAEHVVETSHGVGFHCGVSNYSLNLLGAFNAENALAALALASAFNISSDVIQKGFGFLSNVPGRMEKIDEGQNFSVYVDYAHDAVSLEAALSAAENLKASGANVIVITGGQGSGRDKEKRPVMGEIAARLAHFVIVTNEDPYDDDPAEIIEEIVKSAEAHGKTREKNLFVISDRREGIAKALSLAHAGDLVLVTGKGAEQTMEIYGKSIPWDERGIVREELKKIINKANNIIL